MKRKIREKKEERKGRERKGERNEGFIRREEEW